jgi:hypothetical protein
LWKTTYRTKTFTLLLALQACQNKDSVSAGDGSLTGQFRVEADPVRCALPTTQSLLITQTGARYRFTYDRFGQGAYQLNGITARPGSATAFDLLLDGQKVGQYAFEELRSIIGTRKT